MRRADGGVRRLAHIDDPRQMQFLLRWLRDGVDLTAEPLADRRMTMLFVTIFGAASNGWAAEEACQRLRENVAACGDLIAVLEYRLHAARTRFDSIDPLLSGPLALHAAYTRDEILAGLGHWTLERRPDFREGVLHMPAAQMDAFFITLHKTEDAYSPTTMYEDSAISDQLFHWQSQSTTSVDSPTG